MELSFGLNLAQTQKLVMTPELRQAIKILQLSTVELEKYIQKELLENPVLDLNEDNTKTEHDEKENDSIETDTIDWEEYFQDSSDADFMRFPTERKEQTQFENFISSAPSLQEHLLMQLHLSSIPKTSFKIGEFLIGNIDKRGYLAISTQEAAELLKVSPKEVEDVVKLIQTFEPAGLGARDLVECLLIQVEQNNINEPKIRDFIKYHLKDLAEARYNRIAESLGISLQQVQHLKDLVLTLDPKPGRNFSSPNDTQYITPDAVVEKVGGEYIIIMNDSVSPRLCINSYYRSLLMGGNKDSNISKFLSQRFDSAMWIIKSIEQRRITMYKVIKSIVDVQRDFLDYGLTRLKPLTLKEIADIIEMHESTVSRTVNGKYIQTPRGVFELKFFFQTGLENTNGTSTSSGSIKKMIEEIIESEDPYNPLSDQKISDNLKNRGIIISRRTVAKYRDELAIPSSTKRKRY